MKFIKRILAFVTAAGMCGTAGMYFTSDGQIISAASVVSVSPNSTYDVNNGVFEGWGTSLCWWANRVGYSDELASETAELFFGDSGLRMNIARFNIGGGDDPSHDHITRTDSNMPGYSKYENGQVVYDWNADYNQRNVLMKSIEASGGDLIVEMFSNSPPYYMTESGCTSGNTKSGSNNLKSSWYGGFADYLAEVCSHYQNVWGVKIQSVEPFNEPYTDFWGAYSQKQEGCHFDTGKCESEMITELNRAMNEKNMGDTIIAASDETSIDVQIDAFKSLSGEAKSIVSRIDTHTYGGSKRNELKNLAVSNGKNLWMSEVDGGSVSGENAGEMGAALWLSNRIKDDCTGLNCSAWILWQAIDKHISKDGYNGKKDSGMPDITGGFWGLAVADHDNQDVILTQKYYAFGQYSRYIRPGYTMLKSSDSTVAAYDREGNRLVIVAVNDSSSSKEIEFDLSEFTEIGDSVQVIRTSGSMASGEHWSDAGSISTNENGFKAELKSQSVTTYIIDGVRAVDFSGSKIDISASQVTGSSPWKDSSDVPQNVFDGNTSTFFDGVGNGWVQADLGDVYNISAVSYSPRSGYEYRCPQGTFYSSADGINWNEMYTITSTPAFGMHIITKLRNTENVRYIKYQVPDGKPDGSVNKDSVYCCNIAEIEVYGEHSVLKSYSEGDINRDGTVNTADLVSLLRYLLGVESDIDMEQADIDKSYTVNIVDYILLKSYLAQ